MAVIRVLDIPTGTPTEYLDFEGYLTFDLPPDFRIQATKVRSELTETDALRDEAVLPFDVLKTAKNRWIVKQFASPNVVDKMYEPIPVVAYEGSYYFNFDALFLQGVNDNEWAYTGQLIKSSEFWITQIKGITLDQLDFGSFEYTKANIEATWADMEYNDGDTGVIFAPADYGQKEKYFSDTVIPFETESELPIGPEQLRPFFSLLAVLQKGFCKIGWKFRSPILETERFRKVWCYLLSQDFWEYTGKGNEFWGFLGIKVNNTGSPGGLPWELFISPYNNPSLNASPIFQSFRYENLQSVPVFMGANISGNLPVHSSGNAAIWYFVLEVTDYNFDGSFKTQRQEFQQEVGAGLTAPYSVSFDPVYLEPDRYFELKIYSAQAISPDSRVLEDWPLFSTVSHNTKGAKNLMRDDTFELGKMMNKDYTLLDFVKGVAALGDLKWYTDYATNTVWLYQRSYAYFDGVGVEGFLKSDTDHIDMRGKVVRRSLQSQYPENDSARYGLFEFKSSTDEYIKTLNLDDLAPLHSRIADYKRGQNTIQRFKNPFFEPTAEKRWNAVELPVMWDNDENKISTDIAPRLLYAFGYVVQQSLIYPGVPAVWNWDGVLQSLTPYVSQLPQRLYLVGGSGGTPTLPDWGIVYGYYNEDLYSKLIRSNQVVKRLTERHIYQMFFNDNDYRFNDFRKKWLMRYAGREFLAELVEINNHEFAGNGVTNVTLYPDPQTDSIPECFDDQVSQEITIGHLENHAEVIFYNNTEVITFSANSFIVNGVQQLSSFPVLTIPIAGATVVNINGLAVVTDIVDWLNTLGIPNYTFTDVGAIEGKCGASIKIKYPIGDVFSFAFNLAEVWADDIYGDSERGMYEIYANNNTRELSDPGACGDYYSGRWPGIENINKPVLG